MTLLEYSVHLRFVVHFSPEEVACLKSCAENHYDHTCRAMGEQGGIIYGISNHPGAELGRSDLDRLCKVLEIHEGAVSRYLSMGLRLLIKLADDTYARGRTV